MRPTETNEFEDSLVAPFIGFMGVVASIAFTSMYPFSGLDSTSVRALFPYKIYAPLILILLPENR